MGESKERRLLYQKTHDFTLPRKWSKWRQGGGSHDSRSSLLGLDLNTGSSNDRLLSSDISYKNEYQCENPRARVFNKQQFHDHQNYLKATSPINVLLYKHQEHDIKRNSSKSAFYENLSFKTDLNISS